MNSIYDSEHPNPALLDLHRCYNRIKCEEIWQEIAAANYTGYFYRLLKREYDKKVIELGSTFYYQPTPTPVYSPTYVFARKSKFQLVLAGTATLPIGFFSKDSNNRVQLNPQPVGIDAFFEFDANGYIQPKQI